MKNRLLQRILSLLLTFAFVMSLAGTAGAADIAVALADSSEELTMAEDVEETETADSETEETAETAETTETAETEDVVLEETEDAAEATETVAEEEETVSVQATEEGVTGASESETAASAEEAAETQADTTVSDPDSGWSVEIDRTTGEYEFSFAYEGEDGTLTDAADGYYEIPQGTAEVDGESYTFESGIYYFDEDGSCEQTLEEENVYVEVSELSVTEDSYTVTDESTYEVSLGSVSCENNVISSDVELFSGVEELDELYHQFTDGEDQGVYTGTFLHEELNQVCYASNGEILTTTGSYHWYEETFYTFNKTQDGVAVGTAYTGTYKFSSLPTALQSTYDTGVVYYMKNGEGVADDGHFHWYNNKLYTFNNSSSQKAGISTGTLYTGVVKITGSLSATLKKTYDVGSVYYMKNGVGVADDNHYHWYSNKLYYFSGSSSQKAGISTGTLYTGVVKITGTLSAALKKTYDVGSVYYMKNGVGVKDDGGYHWYGSKLYYFSGSSSQKAGISTGAVYSGYHYCSTVPSSASGYTAKRWYLFKNGVGTLLNGYVTATHTYYKKGVIDTSLTGWKTISGKTYYFTEGVASVGWNYVKRNGSTYKYYFKSDGALVTDLYSYFGKSYYKVSQRIYVNRYTNNITIYQYDSETKSYDIPLKSMVCSTSKTMNLKYGTYTVTRMARWYHKGKWYWQYLTRIGGTGALFHSCRYYSKSTSSMQTSNYNSMGKCNTDLCVRSSVGACRLIYNIVGSQSKGSIKCKYYYAKNNGPFGRMTIANTTGTVKGKKGKDPTQ